MRAKGRPKRMAIRILVTGGTFDKEYDELTGRLYFKDTHIQEMLRLGRCRVPVAVETVMMRDSLEMTLDGPRVDREPVPGRRREVDRRHARHGHDGGDGRGPRRGGDGEVDRPDRRHGAVGVRQLRRPLQPRKRALVRPAAPSRRLRRHERPLLSWDDVRGRTRSRASSRSSAAEPIRRTGRRMGA